MTIKLLAHILRSSPLAVGGVDPAGRTVDFGRWVLEELVMRRREPIGWRRPQPPGRRLLAPRGSGVHGDPNWSDTQPWCHE